MNRENRRAARLALFVVLSALLSPARAAVETVPTIAPSYGFGSAAALSASGAATNLTSPAALFSAPAFNAPSLAAPSIAPSLGLAPSLSAAPAAAPSASLSAVPSPLPALAPAAAPVLPAAISAASPAETPADAKGAGALDSLRDAAASKGGFGGSRFDGSRAAKPVNSAVLVTNDEGVYIMDRAATYYREIRRLVAKLEPRMGLKESLDVMDGTIADVRTKLLVLESIAKDKKISDANTHLEETLTWVDGTLDDGGRKIAVHTHQVFFHPAPEGPYKAASEIAEGNRRVDSYLKQAAEHFAPHGDAERALGELDEVVLAFDTRGYKEIKAHIQEKQAEFKARFGDRVRFAYVDDIAPNAETVAKTRADYNRLVLKHKDDAEGLAKIMEGVMYSRYVGVLLELKTLEYYDGKGYTIVQSGRDMFGEDGKYITELDAVVRSPEGKVLLVEAKSARVTMPPQDALAEKILYKLDTYKKNQAYIEKSIGGPLNVVFSFDVGGRDARAAREGKLVWQNERQKELMEFLEAQAPILTEKYGFPVSFLFLNSHPGENPLLFYQKAEEPAQQSWGGGRKHGKNKRR